MAQSMTFGRSAIGGGMSIAQSTIVTGDNVLTFDTDVAANQTDDELTISLDQSHLKGYYIICNGQMVIETNSAGAPTDTIVLVADQPLIWTGDDSVYYTGLITADVTKMYLTTNAQGTTRTLKMIFVQDSTPT